MDLGRGVITLSPYLHWSGLILALTKSIDVLRKMEMARKLRGISAINGTLLLTVSERYISYQSQWVFKTYQIFKNKSLF